MRIGAFAVVLFIALLTILGFGLPLAQHKLADIDPNYLLTVVSTAGTLGGVAFALYGWFTSREIPKMIEKSAREQADKIINDLNERFYRQQEAMQKVMASYYAKDTDAKIDLLKRAIDQDPTVYNAYVALGYAYWYDKQDYLRAEECFRQDLDLHPENYQS